LLTYKKIIIFVVIIIAVLSAAAVFAVKLLPQKIIREEIKAEENLLPNVEQMGQYQQQEEAPKKYIKWVDFNVKYGILEKTMNLDIKSQDKEVKLSWIEMLSYLAAKYGGEFSRYKEKDLIALTNKLNSGASIDELTKDMKLYSYYKEAYSSVLGGFLGKYKIETVSKENPQEKIWKEAYGLKNFSPIAKGYSFSHCDDFGNQRSYGYARKHLGHDLMGSVGTPIIAVESGIIESLGWNQYGGWRVGIRSYDKKRYYYYAHLKKDHPYNKELKQGDEVKAGDVIGYLGMTGYSAKENVNNIQTPHLHFGMQLIFDEVQKDGINQIWIDTYDIVKLLQKNQSTVYRDKEKNDCFRKFQFEEIK